MSEERDQRSVSRRGSGRWNRRQVLAALAAAGIGSAVFRRALAWQTENAPSVTAEMIRQAEWIAGLELTDEEREATAGAVNSILEDFAAMRAVDVSYEVPPALFFDPTVGVSQLAREAASAGNSASANTRQPNIAAAQASTNRAIVEPMEWSAGPRPDSSLDLAFLPVTELAALLRSRQVSSVELTRLYLERLRRLDPTLHCVVTLTEELAIRQAERADREIGAGQYRGPLHGVPWGAKDLIAVAGYPTTWGATPFREQTLDDTATVARRLEQAGTVLVAKLSLGALAWGDQWFGGMTRNPWRPEQGSSGSSAGSASATSAGLVGFALGSETLGSIVSPSRRCGTTGLRPTFGRVSRHGCMTLAWSMDKIGPMARSVEDCAIVFAAIQGPDGLDGTVHDQPFAWPWKTSLGTLRVGYFPAEGEPDEREELQVLRSLGVKLVALRPPTDLPVDAMTIILNTEAATVFDTITREKNFADLNRWPNAFRQGQFVPAVEYLRANRLRTMLIRDMDTMMGRVDMYVGGNDLAITNLTGHPCVTMPGGFVTVDGRASPRNVTLTGRLFGEASLLAVAHGYQRATGYHLRKPPLE